jgi:cholesterol transport system auxiliary component
MILRCVAVVTAVLLGGCELIKAAEEPTDLYTITPKSTFDPDMPAVFWQLSVEVPSAAANLNTGRIAIAQSPTSSDYYSKTAWTDRAPMMVQTRMVDSFENSHKIVAVAREAIGLRANYVMHSELRNFEAMYFYGGTPIVKVRLVAKLVRMPDRQIIGVATFERCVRARADKVPPAYRRYLVNALRETFDLPGTPIRLTLREKDNPFEGRKRRQR